MVHCTGCLGYVSCRALCLLIVPPSQVPSLAVLSFTTSPHPMIPSALTCVLLCLSMLSFALAPRTTPHPFSIQHPHSAWSHRPSNPQETCSDTSLPPKVCTLPCAWMALSFMAFVMQRWNQLYFYPLLPLSASEGQGWNNPVSYVASVWLIVTVYSYSLHVKTV